MSSRVSSRPVVLEPAVTALYSSQLIWVKVRLRAELTAKSRHIQIAPNGALMSALNDFWFVPTPERGSTAQAQLLGREDLFLIARGGQSPQALLCQGHVASPVARCRHTGTHNQVLGPADPGSNSNYSTY